MREIDNFSNFYRSQFMESKTNRLYEIHEDLNIDASKHLKWKHHNLSYKEFSDNYSGSSYSFKAKIFFALIGTPGYITGHAITAIWKTVNASLQLVKGNTKPIRALPLELARVSQNLAGITIKLFHNTYGEYLRQMAQYELACIDVYKKQLLIRDPKVRQQKSLFPYKHFERIDNESLLKTKLSEIDGKLNYDEGKVIKSRLPKLSSADQEIDTNKNLLEATLEEIMSWSADSIAKNYDQIPLGCYFLFTEQQISKLTLSHLTSREAHGIFFYLEDSEIAKRMQLFSPKDQGEAINLGIISDSYLLSQTSPESFQYIKRTREILYQLVNQSPERAKFFSDAIWIDYINDDAFYKNLSGTIPDSAFQSIKELTKNGYYYVHKEKKLDLIDPDVVVSAVEKGFTDYDIYLLSDEHIKKVDLSKCSKRTVESLILELPPEKLQLLNQDTVSNFILTHDIQPNKIEKLINKLQPETMQKILNQDPTRFSIYNLSIEVLKQLDFSKLPRNFVAGIDLRNDHLKLSVELSDQQKKDIKAKLNLFDHKKCTTLFFKL